MGRGRRATPGGERDPGHLRRRGLSLPPPGPPRERRRPAEPEQRRVLPDLPAHGRRGSLGPARVLPREAAGRPRALRYRGFGADARAPRQPALDLEIAPASGRSGGGGARDPRAAPPAGRSCSARPRGRSSPGSSIAFSSPPRAPIPRWATWYARCAGAFSTARATRKRRLEVYAEAEAHLEALRRDPTAAGAGHIEPLLACPHPLQGRLSARLEARPRPRASG